MNSPYGTFDSAAGEFLIATPRTPRHWYNYLWNDEYVSLFSQRGQGEALSQDGMGRRIACFGERHLFAQDSAAGRLWSLTGGNPDDTSYLCRHGMGYSVIEVGNHDIRSTLTAFVPAAGCHEVWKLTLRNGSQRMCSLRICAATDPGLGGPAKPQAYYTCHSEFDAARNLLLLSNPVVREGAADRQYNFLTMSRPVCGFDSRYQSFVGYGTLQAPDALTRADTAGCTGSLCEMERAVLAMDTVLELAPGAEETILFVTGTARDPQEIEPAFALLSAARADAALTQVRQTIRQRLSGACFATPDSDLNAFAGLWLQRQISLGIRWARVRHNGYRDQVQDIAAFARINPALARDELHRVLTFQYSTGYAPRTWIDGRICDNGFSDNHVWIVPAVHALITETGDPSLLEEVIAFNDGTSASLYEHARRAQEHLWNDRGQHGLCRIHAGDWDDCLNLAGHQGKGVSVWLSQAWLHANRLLADLSRWAGRDCDAATAAARNAEMADAIESAAFRCEGYYVRAFDDAGRVIGALEDTRGRLFINTQTWAALAGLPGARAALETTQRLLERDLGTVCVLDPYTGWRDNVGFMTIKRPGSQENGGVYLHASAFRLVADCLLGNHEAVARALRTMLPFGERPGASECEPYVFCNSYFCMPGSYRHGTPGQSWGTGSAGWFYTALTDYVYGLRPELQGLRLEPCLPPEWTSCAITRAFRGTRYEIRYRQEGGFRRVGTVLVDGQPFCGAHLPARPGETVRVEVALIA